MQQPVLKNNLTKVVTFIALLLLGFLAIVASFSVNLDWPSEHPYLYRPAFLNRYFSDFLLLCCVLLLMQSGGKAVRLIGGLLALCLVFLFFVQSQAFATIGTYLPSLALENADHFDFLAVHDIARAGAIWLLAFGLIYYLVSKWVGQVSGRAALLGAVCLLILSILVKNDKSWLPAEVQQARFNFYNSGRAGVEHTSSLTALADTIEEYLAYREKQNFLTDQAGSLSEQGAEFAYQHFPFLGQQNERYPLLRTIKLDARPSVIAQASESSAKKLNLIVFFSEGVSAKLLHAYRDYFPNLTPNISQFAQHAMRVDNYHNHTFATYRALAGQMCSIYPVGRLFQQVNYQCLGHQLQDAGYSTNFYLSQRLANTDLEMVLNKSGIERVHGATELLRLSPEEKFQSFKILPDRKLFDGVLAALDKQQSAADQPFMLGVYNFETHTGARLLEADKNAAKVSDRESNGEQYLATFKNLDQQFGRFWSYFKDSDFYHNTVVIFTSDHATFPSRDYLDQIEARGVENYSKIFVDDIPLLIYYPGMRGGTAYDAMGTSSIDFAPSVLHLLGIKKVSAPFLGASIFAERQAVPLAGVAGSTDHLLSKNSAGRWRNVSAKSFRSRSAEDQLDLARLNFLRYIESLERANLLSPAQP